MYSELPGGENGQGSLDESGIYLLLTTVSPDGTTGTVSIREVAKPQVELMKIRHDRFSPKSLRIVSSTGTLCVFDGRATKVYDLDIPKLAAQLGTRQ